MDRDVLRGWLADQLGWRSPRATVERIGTGHSRAMFRVAGDEQTVVVRVEQGGVFAMSGAEEFRVMRALQCAGAPVARVLAEEPSGVVLGQPFFVMEFVEGDATTDERSLDRSTATAFVAALDRVHRLDGTALGFDAVPASPDEATPIKITRWRDVYRAASPQPIALLEEASAWLVRHAPPLAELTVVHGDAGPGNFVHAGGRVLAITDWEFAHLGDPAEDWAFCLTMRGARTMPREEWIALFESVAGDRLGEEHWGYWEAFNLFKGACANRTCLDLYERGVNRAPNMAIIGTALHQLFLRRLVAIVHDDH